MGNIKKVSVVTVADNENGWLFIIRSTEYGLRVDMRVFPKKGDEGLESFGFVNMTGADAIELGKTLIQMGEDAQK